jgi:hypothetical protein
MAVRVSHILDYAFSCSGELHGAAEDVLAPSATEADAN